MSYYELYCSDIENVENYEKAKADNFKGWLIHHRLETHTSDGERRKVDLLAKELIALDMYYYRPANELIFLKRSEHMKLHSPGVSTRFKKGQEPPNKGSHLSEEQKHIVSIRTKEAMKSIDMSAKMKDYYESLPPEQLQELKRKMGNHKVFYGDDNASRRPDVKSKIGNKRRNAAQAYRKYKEMGGQLMWNDFNKTYRENIDDFIRGS
jgi:hypothetical protein